MANKPRTGTVYYLKRAGRYVVKVSATHPITRQVKYWTRQTKTSREAHDKIPELKKLADRWLSESAPEHVDPFRITFADLAKIYEIKELVPATFLQGRKVMGRKNLSSPKAWLANLSEYFGKKKLADLKWSDLKDFKAYLINKPTYKNTPRSIAAVNRELEFLRTVLNYAVTNGYLEKNPFNLGKTKLIDRPAENKRERFPGFGEELAIYLQCVGIRAHLAAPLIVAVDTGLRSNEMFSLAITDLDFGRSVIMLRAENAKNNQAREIPMTERCRRELVMLCTDNETGLVFGGLVDPKRSWATAKRLAGVTGLNWHDLRHAFVSRAILAGIPPAAALKASGHASDEWKRYLNITPDQMGGLLAPLPGQTSEEVRRYAVMVMRGLRDALGYDKIDRLFEEFADS